MIHVYAVGDFATEFQETVLFPVGSANGYRQDKVQVKHVRVKVERERACRKLPDSAHDFRAEQRHILFNAIPRERHADFHCEVDIRIHQQLFDYDGDSSAVLHLLRRYSAKGGRTRKAARGFLSRGDTHDVFKQFPAVLPGEHRGNPRDEVNQPYQKTNRVKYSG